MKIIMNPDGTISFKEDEIEFNDINFVYEQIEIEESIIEKCEELSELNNKVYFIFDDKISNTIETNNNRSKEILRDEKIDLILGNEKGYHIGTEDDFRGLPSRFSYYDTETKLVGRYRRYDFVTAYLGEIGFIPSITNISPEFEQSYLIELTDEKFICRLQPNLRVNIIYQNTDSIKTIFDGFFKKKEIFEVIKSVAGASFARDLKLSKIL